MKKLLLVSVILVTGKLFSQGTPVQVFVAGGAPLCSKECRNVQAQAVGGTAPYTFTWQPGGFVGNPLVACPSATTVYTVTVQDSQSASGSNTVSITVQTPPAITATGSAICAGQTGSLTASGGLAYTWSSGTSPQFGSQVSASPTSTTTYTVTSTGQNGCTGSATAAIAVTPAGKKVDASWKRDTICYGTSIQVCATGATTYTWGAIIPASVTNLSCTQCSCTTINPPGLGTYPYTVIGSDPSGCASLPDTVTLVVEVCTGTRIKEETIPSYFSAFVKDRENGKIGVEYFSLQSENLKITVADLLGRVVYTHEFAKQAGAFNQLIELRSRGVHNLLIISVTAGDKTWTQKLVMTR